MPPLAIAGGAIGLGSIIGGVIQGNAATNAGNAQVAAANTQVGFAQQGLQAQIAARQASVTQAGQLSAMSPGEMASINQILQDKTTALNASLSSISQQQQQVNNMSPDVQAAGQNLYNLLTGQAASILGPLQQQQALQKQQLVNNLTAQMGPGYATSTAGIQALTAFDQQSALTNAQAQLQAVNQATSSYAATAGLAQQGQNAITSQTQGAYTQAQTSNALALQANQVVQSRQTNAYLGALQANPINFQAPAAAQQSAVSVAGNPFSGQGILGQTIGQAGGGIGGAVIANNLFGGSGNQGSAGGAGISSSQIGAANLAPNVSFGANPMSQYNATPSN